MSDTTTDLPVCGYVRADGTICTMARGACSEHEQSRFQVCSGCGGKAFRECSQEMPGSGACKMAVCYGCGHQFDDSHGPTAGAPMDDPSTRPPDVPPGIAELREDLVATASRALSAAQEVGKIAFTGRVSADDLARELVDALATHSALMSLSAAARAVQS